MGEVIPAEKTENTPDSIILAIVLIIFSSLVFGAAIYYHSRKDDDDLNHIKPSNMNKVAVTNDTYSAERGSGD